ncbi:MAG: hypothetical protein IJU13_06775 [Bacteroidales bacterium]|nr:hypothetical protein [Bacteroidales bacterium]
MKRFFLLTTDHLEDRLWFRDEEDFRVAMNYVAIAAFLSGVYVLAFILMSNHVHFVLSCDMAHAKLFICKFKRLYSAYYQRKYGVFELLRRNGVDIREISEEDESLERAIAYVLMNSVAANICMEPAGYPWGTGNVLFNENPFPGQRLGELSRRAQIRLLNSNITLPPDYRLAPGGYILPESYVPLKAVESLFRTPKRLNYFLRTSSKARIRLDGGATPSFRDQLILSACGDLCHSLFRANGIADLIPEQKAELLRQLGRRFSSDLNQLCRVTGIPYAEAAKLLDSF